MGHWEEAEGRGAGGKGKNEKLPPSPLLPAPRSLLPAPCSLLPAPCSPNPLSPSIYADSKTIC